jgi:hypothetical protein
MTVVSGVGIVQSVTSYRLATPGLIPKDSSYFSTTSRPVLGPKDRLNTPTPSAEVKKSGTVHPLSHVFME